MTQQTFLLADADGSLICAIDSCYGLPERGHRIFFDDVTLAVVDRYYVLSAAGDLVPVMMTEEGPHEI